MTTPAPNVLMPGGFPLPQLLSDAATAKPVWIQLGKTGHWAGHPQGPFSLNAAIFEQIKRNFDATANHEIPVDFEHATEKPVTEGSIAQHGAPAQGWIRQMRITAGNLFGLVEWGEEARALIKAKKYRYISPAIRFESKDRETGKLIGARMTSAALTNNPWLDGMLPVAAKDVATLAPKSKTPTQMPTVAEVARRIQVETRERRGIVLPMSECYAQADDLLQRNRRRAAERGH